MIHRRNPCAMHAAAFGRPRTRHTPLSHYNKSPHFTNCASCWSMDRLALPAIRARGLRDNGPGTGMVHEAKDLTPAERAAVELLLGRPLTDEETISVQAFNATRISEEQRRHVTAELRRLFAEADQSLQSATDPDTERLFTEAMRSSRPGYRTRS